MNDTGYLFPRAMWMPGWHHVWDGVLQSCLKGASWWPDFLKDVRAAMAWFRVQTYRRRFMDEVRKDQHHPGPLERQPPNFANWRWSTMHQ
eukprot:7635300-Pyramimonas_sp.AAC.1